MSTQQFGRYEILRELGRGGMATVFVGRDTELDREVAVKVLPREFMHDREFLSRFKREARVAALDHKAIVPVYDIGEQDGQPYIVMKLMSGGSLEARLAAGPLAPPEALDVLRRMASALDFAHRKHVIHRDVKPANVLFDDEGDAYISDFGIAKAIGNTVTKTRGVIGTPAYMSPEQFRPQVVPDGRSDQYALAIVAYELLTGRPPFEAEDMVEYLHHHIYSAPPPVQSLAPSLPPSLDGPLHTALAKDRDQRYATCKDFVAALSSAVQASGLSVATASPQQRTVQASLTPPQTPAPGVPAVFCDNCGTSNRTDAKYCRECGAALNAPAAQPAPAATPAPARLNVAPAMSSGIEEARPTPPPTPQIAHPAPPPASTAASPPTPAPRSERTLMSRLLIAVPVLLVLGVIAAVAVAGVWLWPQLQGLAPVAEVPNTATTRPEPTEPPPEPTEAPIVVEEPTEAPAPEPTERRPVDANDPYAAIDPAGQTVVLWHSFMDEREELLWLLAEEYSATNEYGITVIPENVGSYGDIYEAMFAVMHTEDSPALVFGWQQQLAEYQFDEALVDLNTLVRSEAWGLSGGEIDDHFPGIYNADTFPAFDNARLGFAIPRSQEVLYYNRTWLDEFGVDPTDLGDPWVLYELACVAAYDGSFNGEQHPGYEFSMDASRFVSWVFAFGGDIYDREAHRYTFDSPAAIEAANYLQMMYQDGCFKLADEPYGEQLDFAEGRVVFTTGSSSGIPFYTELVNELGGFEWGTALMPWYYVGEPAQNSYGPSLAIPRTTAERELAAWLFAKWLDQPDIQREWVIVNHSFPTRESTFDYLAEAGYLDERPAYTTLLEGLYFARTEPPAPFYTEVRAATEEYLYAILEGSPVEDTLTELNDYANSTLP